MDNKEKLANSFIYALRNIKGDSVNVVGLKIPTKRLLDQAFYATGDPSLHPSFNDNKRLENARAVFAEMLDREILDKKMTAENLDIIQVIHDPQEPLATRELFANTFSEAFDEVVPRSESAVYQAPQIPTPQALSQMQNEVASKVIDIGGDGFKKVLNRRAGEKVVEKVAEKGVEKAAVSAGTKLGAKALGGVIGGALTGGLGWVAMAAGELLKGALRKISPTLAKNADRLGALAMGLGIGSLVAPALLAPAAAVGAAAFWAGGTAAYAAGAGLIAAGAIALFSAAVAMMVTPVVITLIVIPLSLAAILFVINSGAYIVPPGGPLGSEYRNNLPVNIKETDTCFTFTGEWPTIYQSHMIRAIDTMARTGAYMDKICSQGTVFLEYRGLANYGGEVIANNRILIYGMGTDNPGSAIYTLAHESGHIFARRFRNVQDTLYRNDVVVNAERPVCTYPLDEYRGSLGEDFAEMIALFIYTSPSIGYKQPDTTGNLACIYPSYKATYPNHVNFAATYIFESTLGW